MQNNLRAIEAREQALRQAQLAGDVDAIDELLADDLIGTDQTGQLFTKADDLALHRAGIVKLSRIDVVDQQVRDLGDVVVTITNTSLAGSFQGESIDGNIRYTRVWHWRDGRWRIAAATLAPLA